MNGEELVQQLAMEMGPDAWAQYNPWWIRQVHYSPDVVEFALTQLRRRAPGSAPIRNVGSWLCNTYIREKKMREAAPEPKANTL